MRDGLSDRDESQFRLYQLCADQAAGRLEGADSNLMFFSHPKCAPLTLSSPNPETRRFWVEHGKACIRISSYLARELGQSCTMNIWTGDGFKDIPADRMGPRQRYQESLDEILSEPYNFNEGKPCVESKVFGIGVEAYTAGSADWKTLQNQGKFTQLLVQQEELKTLPFGEVWKEYCFSCGVPTDGQWMKTVEDYENSELRKRV